MEFVGSKLKAQREQLGFSLEEMSRKTKLSIQQIQALEEGDTSFFHDDLSYVPYITRFYAQALYLDYDEIRQQVNESIDDYHKTQQMKVVAQREQMESNIHRKVSSSSIGKKSLKPVGKRRIDYSFLSLIAIIIILVISLIFVFFAFVLPMIQQGNQPTNQDPIIGLPTNPNDEVKEPTDPNTPDPVVSSVSFALDSSSLLGRPIIDVVDFSENEEVTIHVKFASDTWIKVYFDGIATNNPQSRIYKPDESMEIRTIATDGLEVLIHFGFMRGNEIFFNDQAVVLDSYSTNATSGVRVTFRFKGDPQ